MAKKDKGSDAGADEPGLGLTGGVAKGEGAYRVLARKYRPQNFEDAFIGQSAMVRTLGNAFASGRVAHAFMLTGVRGVGKTTTARIVAKALNCIGPDGKRVSKMPAFSNFTPQQVADLVAFMKTLNAYSPEVR